MSLDVHAYWDFDDPAGSEQRFRIAREQATSEAARAVLTTQVARALGLQGRFHQGHAELASISRDALADPEVAARAALERGRLHRNSGDPDGAEPAFESAARLAEQAGLGDLHVDALHMLALLPDDPAEQARRNRRALDVARSSADAGARRWVPSLLNNLGMALHETGDDRAALAAFEEALAELRQRDGDPGTTRIAAWMVAWAKRLLGRDEEALQEQLALAAEHEAAGTSDPYVHDELAELYTARGDRAAAEQHRAEAERQRS
ncbi:MAG TPA: tetratricopeptide repeat protein [Ornithinicoccus sp.]|nr:tetratricopeptide repeat protein [Ornithinicoccus sp.]